jgi:hypothetical protein
MAMPVFEQVDAELCEDGRTVMLYAHAAGETCFVATILLPFAVTEEAFVPEAWAAVRNVTWLRH